MFKRRMIYVACVAVLLSMTAKVQAVDYHYWTDGDPLDSNWETAGNWSNDLVPGLNMPYLQSDVFVDGGNCYITGSRSPVGAAAHSQWLTIGLSSMGTLNIVEGGQMGGEPWGPGEAFIGGRPDGTADAVGILNIDGDGTVARLEGIRLGSNAVGGEGVINVTNGGSLIVGWWGTRIGGDFGKGTVNLINGTMQTLGELDVSGNEGLSIGASGKIILYPTTTFTLSTDKTELVNGYITEGKIVPTGSGRCSLVVSYDEDLNMTTVSVEGCTCTTFLEMDVNHDCYVDSDDLAIFAEEWLSCTDPIDPACQ